MKTSTRPREVGGSFASRRGHATQLSLGGDNHVTEAIGDMYGDDEYSKRDSRPLSFVTSQLQESIESRESYFDASKGSRMRPPLNTNGNMTNSKSQTVPGTPQSPRSTSLEKSALSPTLSPRDRTASDTANTPFPLSDIDYESDPAAVAQELSNLQALRRMSMDVGNTSDPDLPSFQGVSLSVAPTGDDDEDDPSRLFWVPARVHPELAPMEFKSFLEKRVQTIKRRSGEQPSLSPDGVERSGSGSSLRRKKSMLSRQINNEGGRGAVGYKDGSDQIERQKSLSSHTTPGIKIADLKGLDALVRDPSKAMAKLTLETGNREPGNTEVPLLEDMPILPQAPGVGLRRSKHTTYRKGSLRKGERVPFSKRAGAMRAETDGEDSPASSPIDGRPAIGFPLTKVQSEPITTENFSRPNRGGRRFQSQAHSSTTPSLESKTDDVFRRREESPKTVPEVTTTPPQAASLPRSNTFPRNDSPVPRIIETPPPTEDNHEPPPPTTLHQFPERSSSQQTPPPPKQKQAISDPPARSNRRPALNRQDSSTPPLVQRATPPSQTLNDMAQHPSPLPGSSARTDILTFIPTLDEKKSEKKSKRDKDDENSSSRKPSWGWFKGSDEKEKKDKKKEEENRKGKAKSNVDKSHDTARLDVLQSTMDTAVPRGRESLLLDRDNLDTKLLDERKKESSRKSGGENKKEKDGLFSSFFSSSKKKGDRDSGGKKGSSLRTLSPDPPHRRLKPDVDYNWTRFSILEERAIYRMAHIKLANPRRALHSQVLLSNFMYSYLAKVQQMHPQMQIPQSALQKKQEAERRQKELEKQQQQDGGEQYRYDYHSGITKYAEESSSPQPQPQNQVPKSDGVNYVDDSQIYDYDHQDDDHGQTSNRPQSRAAQHNAENNYGEQDQYGRQYSYSKSEQHDHAEDEEDMW